MDRKRRAAFLDRDGVINRDRNYLYLPDAVVPEYRIDCDCRKPQPGMIVDIATHLGLDLGNSILVGDKVSDVQAGRAAGVGSCFLVRSGHPLSAADERIADAVYADLAECAAALATSDRPTVGGSSI